MGTVMLPAGGWWADPWDSASHPRHEDSSLHLSLGLRCLLPVGWAGRGSSCICWAPSPLRSGQPQDFLEDDHWLLLFLNGFILTLFLTGDSAAPQSSCFGPALSRQYAV
ncbi:hypothetical protein NPIL_396561 [Nephila pilipes]|uniref:Uncharacterized protein n=1 Tax=Nephila pilipes TaxID=299642 RepID=A0A8X6N029_NEPPI|nr:hypothetical protein NPIL_396561 [Nephila pilipes]